MLQHRAVNANGGVIGSWTAAAAFAWHLAGRATTPPPTLHRPRHPPPTPRWVNKMTPLFTQCTFAHTHGCTHYRGTLAGSRARLCDGGSQSRHLNNPPAHPSPATNNRLGLPNQGPRVIVWHLGGGRGRLVSSTSGRLRSPTLPLPSLLLSENRFLR